MSLVRTATKALTGMVILCVLMLSAMALNHPIQAAQTKKKPNSTVKIEDKEPKGSIVKVVPTKNGFQLVRNGKPFFVRGVGGDQYLDRLKAAGGNSIRTWGADKILTTLKAAGQHGLTVCMGIWLGHERHGFRYDNTEQVAAQRKAVENAVLQGRNHPALLVWALGNEMEGDGKNPLIWKEINFLAKRVKQLDPNHPTMTIVAEISQEKISALIEHCPDIDILGVNSYGGLRSLGKRLKDFGWNKPFMVTEYGPLGHWEGGFTSWGAPIEMDSARKAEWYTVGYLRTIAPRGLCLGSFAFLWGHKQETTGTWFSMFLPSGESLNSVDSVSYLWTGKFPENRAPRILDVDTSAAMKEITPGSVHEIVASVVDDDGDPIEYSWEVRQETNDRKLGGDSEAAPPSVANAITGSGARVKLVAPTKTGAYRIFLLARDGKNHAATANIPFFVKE